MFLCSPLTGAALLLYASWWALGARASHLGRVHHSRVLCNGSRCLSSLERVASESKTGKLAETKVWFGFFFLFFLSPLNDANAQYATLKIDS